MYQQKKQTFQPAFFKYFYIISVLQTEARAGN